MSSYKNFIIHQFETLDSTNSHAFNLAQNKQAFDREVIVASRQNAGRGRMDRKWQSEHGNLFFSLIIRPQNTIISAKNAHKLSFLSILALHTALSHFNDNNKIEMKWPNDLLINQKKVAGILLESEFNQDQLDFAILGIGVNITSHPDNVLFPATHLHQANILTQKDQILEKFLDEFEKLYQLVEQFGLDETFKNIRNIWLKNAYKINEMVSVNLGEEKISGVFNNVDEEGCLELTINNNIKKISFGDVS